jgi:hypothetical protein
MKPGCKLAWIVFFAVAMGYLESSVVVYLRALYYPEGFYFPLKPMASSVVVTELYREAATLIMIFSISVLAAKIWLHRFAWFLVIFGIWDIMYYVFLKLLLNWPESLFTTDILFLLPSIWTGPVLAPLLNSATMLLLASVILISRKRVLPITRLTKFEWILLIMGSIPILIAYIKGYWIFVLGNTLTAISGEITWSEFVNVLPAQFVPGPFDWMLFGAGVLMHFGAILLIVFRIRVWLLQTNNRYMV